MTYEEYPGERARFDAEYADYQRRARTIDDWAQAQYAAGKMSESAIERAVEHMFDALDADYTGPCIDRGQTRADFHLED
jgi:wobble nucleotide-excising tRNase